MSLMDEIETLLESDRLEEALERLDSSISPTSNRQELIGLRSRLFRLKTDYRQNVVSREDYIVERNRILQDIFEFASRSPTAKSHEEWSPPVSKKYASLVEKYRSEEHVEGIVSDFIYSVHRTTFRVTSIQGTDSDQRPTPVLVKGKLSGAIQDGDYVIVVGRSRSGTFQMSEGINLSTDTKFERLRFYLVD